MSCDRNTLKSIEEWCGVGNAPDLGENIYIIPNEDIISPMPTMEEGTHTLNANAVALTNTGKKWERFQISVSDNALDMGSKGDVDNHHFEPKIEGFIGGLDGTRTYALMKARRSLAVIVIDNNGMMRLMRKARLVFDETTKSKNGYKITFTCGVRRDPLPYIKGFEHEIPLAVAP